MLGSTTVSTFVGSMPFAWIHSFAAATAASKFSI
jgi:hypothetical protein